MDRLQEDHQLLHATLVCIQVNMHAMITQLKFIIVATVVFAGNFTYS